MRCILMGEIVHSERSSCEQGRKESEMTRRRRRRWREKLEFEEEKEKWSAAMKTSHDALTTSCASLSAQ